MHNQVKNNRASFLKLLFLYFHLYKTVFSFNLKQENLNFVFIYESYRLVRSILHTLTILRDFIVFYIVLFGYLLHFG